MSDGAAILRTPGPRVVLLGASNVRIALRTIVGLLEAHAGPHLQILAACGHGRSYGSTTRVFGVEMPSIGACGLWSTLALAPPQPTVALVTDVGNDIMYGADVDQIAAWVERDLERLSACGAEIVVVRLPLAAIDSLSEGRYRIARALLFPRRRLSLREVTQRAHELDRRLIALAEARRHALVEPAADWYGWDPIHVRARRRSHAWSVVAARMLGRPLPEARVELAKGDRRLIARLRPQTRRVWGIAQTRAQPSGRLSSGTTIALY